MRREKGFGLVAALFLIIVVAGAIAAMARLSTTSSGSITLGIQQARAYQVARAGIEWGIRQSQVGACSSSQSYVFEGFNVVVQCARTSIAVPEESLTPAFYQIISTAQFGAVGNPDYAYRQLTAVIEGN